MAIDRIPGVGPANSDIAAATAAVVPNSAAITAAVPTTGQIATAVAAPSAATIAAAVAAPSSATIATAVAAAVPTTGGITTIVQNNAATQPTWTLLGSVTSDPGASTVTISGLSTAYKALRIEVVGVKCISNFVLCLRFNGDSTGVYSYHKEYIRSEPGQGMVNSNGDNHIRLRGLSETSGNAPVYASAIIQNSSNASERSKFYKATYGSQTASGYSEFTYDNAVYRPSSASAITSITLFELNSIQMTGFGLNNQSGFFVYGGN